MLRWWLLSVALMAGANQMPAAGPDIKKDKYVESAAEDLRLFPEKYLHKYVSLKVKFFGFIANFPPYFNNAGIKHDKYLWLNVKPAPLPVFMSKQEPRPDELKEHTAVTLYGKVQKLNNPRLRETRYYLLVERIELEPLPD